MAPSSLQTPQHVAIIMDGNGRWATRQGLSRSAGHKAGAETIKTVLDTCEEVGIHFLTLYAFSTENWKRPKTEVAALMELLIDFLGRFEARFMEHGIRLNAIGQISSLPAPARFALTRVMEKTAGNERGVLTLALSYGARDELVTAAKRLGEKVASGELAANEITEEVFAGQLFTADLPDPDLVIRTAGEMRLSNFLLWQLAYAEFVSTPTLWPDFNREEFLAALEEFRQRKRRFGGIESNV